MKSHLCTSFYRQKQNITLTDLVWPTPLTICYSTVPIAADGCSAAYVLPVQTERVLSDRFVRSNPGSTFDRQKQNVTPTDLFRPTPLTASPNTTLTAAGGSSATYLLKMQTEQNKTDNLVRLHPSSTLYGQNRRYAY